MQVIMGRKTDGTYKEIAVNDDGELRIESDITVTVAPGDINIGNVDVVSMPALPAGANKIGSIDVASMPAITGAVTATGPLTNTELRATPVPVSGTVTANPPAAPVITRLLISKNTTGDSTIIAAPVAPNRIYYELLKFQNNSDAAMTATVKFGAADTNGDPTYMATRGDGYSDAPTRGYVKLPAATALVINLDVDAKQLTGHVRYWIAE